MAALELDFFHPASTRPDSPLEDVFTSRMASLILSSLVLSGSWLWSDSPVARFLASAATSDSLLASFGCGFRSLLLVARCTVASVAFCFPLGSDIASLVANVVVSSSVLVEVALVALVLVAVVVAAAVDVAGFAVGCLRGGMAVKGIEVNKRPTERREILRVQVQTLKGREHDALP